MYNVMAKTCLNKSCKGEHVCVYFSHVSCVFLSIPLIPCNDNRQCMDIQLSPTYITLHFEPLNTKDVYLRDGLNV